MELCARARRGLKAAVAKALWRRLLLSAGQAGAALLLPGSRVGSETRACPGGGTGCEGVYGGWYRPSVFLRSRVLSASGRNETLTAPGRGGGNSHGRRSWKWCVRPPLDIWLGSSRASNSTQDRLSLVGLILIFLWGFSINWCVGYLISWTAGPFFPPQLCCKI